MEIKDLVNAYAKSQEDLFKKGINHFLSDCHEPDLFTTQTLKISGEQISILKRAIYKFTDSLSELSNSGVSEDKNNHKIYFFNSQLFPISKSSTPS